ncbi:MAG: class I tRNA ligase family protein, partial [bacterium]|nr:class I tRNA ligase family protein [bacterium]
MAKNKGKKPFVFYEGPPTANGRPHLGHVIARVFKDIIPRYKTMNGYFVPRQAGWDTQGLPVEIEVEKKLGFKSKKDIEKYGIAEFNKLCRQSVWEYKDLWEKFTEKIGFWVDLKNPYITYENDYLESLWWIIKQFSKKKLLYQGHKIVLWCSRCGTTLSSHEVAQGYKEVEENSVFIKFKLKKGQKINNFTTDDKTYILSWTTTPWTLPGNVALAVGEKVDYKIVRNKENKESYILASALSEKVLEGFNFEKIAEVKGKSLIGLAYQQLFDIPELRNEKSHKVYAADFVTTEDGTGVVHTAVMYGEDDYELGKKIGLPQWHTVSEDGRFVKEVEELAGMFAKTKDQEETKKTEKKIIDYLTTNNYLLKTQLYKHDYPFCWRCNTPLLYYARSSWFVAMSRLRSKLLASNQKINWVPEHLKKGRFGEWLKDVKDWNFSRERYWGTPLPIWQCEGCDNQEVIGGREELAAKHRA